MSCRVLYQLFKESKGVVRMMMMQHMTRHTFTVDKGQCYLTSQISTGMEDIRVKYTSYAVTDSFTSKELVSFVNFTERVL